MRIIFMGTPEFAVPSLQALLDSRHAVVGIVTQPDRPKGRGKRLIYSPIKQLAMDHHVPYLQPTKMKSPELLNSLRQWNPDVIVVVAFGRILPKAILDLPPRACINVHASLLPRYRGAAPIQWAIINGETETGVTTMLMDEGMDTGDILLQEVEPILPTDTAETLSSRLAQRGGTLLLKTLDQWEQGTLVPQPQNHQDATLAPPLTKKDGEIDWHLDARRLADRIRGLSPWPGSSTYWGKTRLTIWQASAQNHVAGETPDAPPGTVVLVNKQYIGVATGKGILLISEIQAANGRRMPVAQFLAGNPLQPGMVFHTPARSEGEDDSSD